MTIQCFSVTKRRKTIAIAEAAGENYPDTCFGMYVDENNIDELIAG